MKRWRIVDRFTACTLGEDYEAETAAEALAEFLVDTDDDRLQPGVQAEEMTYPKEIPR